MTNAIIPFDNLSPLGSLNEYVQRVHAVPVLTAEQEQALAERFYYEQDLDAARQLVMAHLRFVVRIAKGYSGYGLNEADLIQEGNIGLMKAVKRFDPTVGVRLVTFAVHWVKAEIHDYVIRNWRIVKIATTKAQRKLFFNLRQFKKKLTWFSQDELQDVANDLGVSTHEVKEMELRLKAHDAQFDAPVADDPDTTSLAPADYLASDNTNPAHMLENHQWQSRALDQLEQAMHLLSDREKQVLTARRLQEPKVGLKELAATLNVSMERVRQIEQQALKKLQEAVSV